MSIELITGMGGTNHVDSEDVGALNAELIGNGNYLLSGCEVTMTDANTCHVAAGELLLQGRHVRIKGAGEDVSIGNGQAGYNQRYLICLVYSKATSGIETVGLQAFAGAKTTGTATDPAVAAGSILGGDTNVVVPLARLELTGLSVGTPAVMLDSVKGLVALGAETKKLGDSVYHGSEWVTLWSGKNDTYVEYRTMASIVFFRWRFDQATAEEWIVPSKIPAGLRPKGHAVYMASTLYFSQSGSPADHVAWAYIEQSGTIRFCASAAVSNAINAGSGSWIAEQ